MRLKMENNCVSGMERELGAGAEGRGQEAELVRMDDGGEGIVHFEV